MMQFINRNKIFILEHKLFKIFHFLIHKGLLYSYPFLSVTLWVTNVGTEESVTTKYPTDFKCSCQLSVYLHLSNIPVVKNIAKVDLRLSWENNMIRVFWYFYIVNLSCSPIKYSHETTQNLFCIIVDSWVRKANSCLLYTSRCV